MVYPLMTPRMSARRLAGEATGLGRQRQACVPGLKIREARAYAAIHGRGLPGRRTHMQIQLLGGGDECVIAPSMQAVEQRHALVVNLQHPRRHIQRLEGARFAAVREVCFDAVQRAPGLAVGSIDADIPENRIGRIAKYLQITRIGHVSVVVDPLRPHLGLEQPQRLTTFRARGSRIPRGVEALTCGGGGGFIQALLERAQGSARADVEVLQHMLDSDQVVVPQTIESSSSPVVATPSLTRCRISRQIASCSRSVRWPGTSRRTRKGCMPM